MEGNGSGSLRLAMPELTAWFDVLRNVWGREEIDGQLRKGLRGECQFHAKENGHELGKLGDRGAVVTPRQFVSEDRK